MLLATLSSLGGRPRPKAAIQDAWRAERETIIPGLENYGADAWLGRSAAATAHPQVLASPASRRTATEFYWIDNTAGL